MDFALQLSTGSGRWDKQISQNIYFLVQIYLKHNSQNIIPPEFDMSQFLGGIKSPTTTVGRVLETGQTYFTNRGGVVQSHRMFVCFCFSWKKYFWWQKNSDDKRKDFLWRQEKHFLMTRKRISSGEKSKILAKFRNAFSSDIKFSLHQQSQNLMECRFLRVRLFLHTTGLT